MPRSWFAAAVTLGQQEKMVEMVNIPIIDLGRLQHKSTRAQAIDDIGRASQTLGCFKVINHGIDESVIKGAMEQASKFFELADGEKSHLTSDDVEKPVRYGQINNSRAFLKLYAHPIGEWIEFWPHSPPYFRLKISCYATAVRKLALELMDAVLESLGLDQACLMEKLEEGIQLMAMNCYQTSQHLHDCTIGMPPHSDYGCLTILFQSCEGLEIIDRSNGNWKAVPDTPESLHVHIGDHLEVLSNGRYKSVVHRVVYNSRCRRISIASIQGLSMDQKVITAEELVDEKHPTAYKDTSFREFLQYLLSTTDYANGVSYIDSLRIFNP